jgi:hypothetical protein
MEHVAPMRDEKFVQYISRETWREETIWET